MRSFGCAFALSLLVVAPAFADAVRTAGELRRPSVGCHVVLVDGEPVLPRELVASLLRGNTARFHNRLTAFAHDAVRHRIAPDQIEAEATAQMRRLADAGIRISHFDTHKHTHLFPAVLQPLLRAATTCGVRAVRNPFAPLKPLAFAHLLRRPHLWKRYTEVKLLRGWGTNFQR